MPGVTYDIYGLHAENCACPRCEAGYRPTAMARANAHLWALQHEKHVRAVVETERLLENQKPVSRPTAEELAAMRSDVERMKRGKSNGR